MWFGASKQDLMPKARDEAALARWPSSRGRKAIHGLALVNHTTPRVTPNFN
jgi:hypothetical protein